MTRLWSPGPADLLEGEKGNVLQAAGAEVVCNRGQNNRSGNSFGTQQCWYASTA